MGPKHDSNYYEEIFWLCHSHLLAAVDDVLREGESADGGAADDRVVAGRRVRHLHRAELQERLAQRHPTQKQLSAF